MALCRAAGFAPRIVTETSDLFSLLQLVRAGVGVGLVPAATAAMRVTGVRLLEVRLPQAAWDIALARRRQAEHDPLLDAFLRVVREVSAEAGQRRPRRYGPGAIAGCRPRSSS
jgi:DNA-binding transcriptional LysR family regulator